MSIGKNLAFPRSGIRELDGMTYRQWLIGQILGAVPATISLSKEAIADSVVLLADAIIARLDAELEKEE